MFVEFQVKRRPMSISSDKIIGFLPDDQGDGTEIRFLALNSLGHTSLIVDQDYMTVKSILDNTTVGQPNRPSNFSRPSL